MVSLAIVFLALAVAGACTRRRPWRPWPPPGWLPLRQWSWSRGVLGPALRPFGGGAAPLLRRGRPQRRGRCPAAVRDHGGGDGVARLWAAGHEIVLRWSPVEALNSLTPLLP